MLQTLFLAGPCQDMRSNDKQSCNQQHCIPHFLLFFSFQICGVIKSIITLSYNKVVGTYLCPLWDIYSTVVLLALVFLV